VCRFKFPADYIFFSSVSNWIGVDDIFILRNPLKVIESSGFGADKFTMVRNNDGTGSLKVVQPLDYEDKLQRNGFRFMIQVNDKVGSIFLKSSHFFKLSFLI
jgi:hypothetical protein